MVAVLNTVLVCIFAIGLSSTYAGVVLGSNRNSDGQVIQTKTEVKKETIKDPVCGMVVRDQKKELSEEYKGKVYYFCAEYCKEVFKKDPASYTTPESKPQGHVH
ncbi:MAG: YHS domain-containing protein [Candidatus Loosdrechtia sp.]|uniref:YHS domain-containing protein n=1 Tax=Candidatus Loosdrechtia sp. TaxID=3101272 RepID=UPI003A604344|nr:MAG: YHS domain-containing protein [Candidatus Jettenia sp. AMX2]